MSGPAVYHGPDGLVARSCHQHGRYVVHALAVAGCPRCRENARHARNQRLARERAGLVCTACGCDLLKPAPLCGFCDPDHDPFAVLAAMDAETSPTPRERQ
jgi:hypothetical protein